jgi:hypothetical protein
MPGGARVRRASRGKAAPGDAAPSPSLATPTPALRPRAVAVSAQPRSQHGKELRAGTQHASVALLSYVCFALLALRCSPARWTLAEPPPADATAHFMVRARAHARVPVSPCSRNTCLSLRGQRDL